MKKTITINICLATLAMLAVVSSCDKVSPTGVLIAGTGVEDRVEMSYSYYLAHKGENKTYKTIEVYDDDYTFLVGADSHLATDSNRLAEMFDIALENGDVLIAHLGDIADTKAEYYINLDNTITAATENWLKKVFPYSYYDEDYDLWFYSDDLEIDSAGWYTIDDYEYYTPYHFPFYPVVGNHDITHNGWALWSSIFGSSFYTVDVAICDSVTGNCNYIDHYIFIDSANGTLGELQSELIEDDNFYKDEYRNTFVFTHTNIFRPQSWQFASTFAREETYFLLNKFTEWEVDAVFMGHVHEWDERQFGDTYYVTLPSMGERNSPEPGDYLVRVTVHGEDSIDIDRVHMSYTPNKK